MSGPLEMDPEIRARWVTALRSGEYRQAYEVLRNDAGGRCCLGVLCEIAVADGVLAAAVRSRLDGSWQYDGHDTELPEAVQSWAGLSSNNPYVDVKDVPVSLAELNDGDEERGSWTFAQIADVIEGALTGAGSR